MAYSGPVIDVRYEVDPRDDMDSYQELCYEVGLDLEPNKYAKLRKQAMLAQEEQNDPMPWPLLFIDELCLKMKDKLRRGKREEFMDSRPPRKAIRQIEDLDNLTQPNGPSNDHDPYAIASAPDNNSPSRNGNGVMPSTVGGGNMTRTACTNLPTKLYGAFSYPGSNPLNFGDYEVEDEGLPFDIRRRNIMRNTVFMVNMCFSGEYFEGDLQQALKNGIDELAIVKKWRKGATTEMKWKKMIEYIALSHFPHIKKGQLKLSDVEFKRQIGRQRIALNPTVNKEALFEWMVDFAFRLGNVPLMEPPSEEFQEIPFYEWAGAPVYPEFEFQEVRTKGKTKTRLVLELGPYTVADLKRLESDQWCFLFNE